MSIFSNYEVRLSKTPWHVFGEKINHAPKPNLSTRHRLVTLFCDNKLGMQFAKIVCHIYFPESQTAWECNLLFSGNKTAPDQYNNKQQDWDRCYPREDHYFKEIIHPSPVSSWPMKKKKIKRIIMILCSLKYWHKCYLLTLKEYICPKEVGGSRARFTSPTNDRDRLQKLHFNFLFKVYFTLGLCLLVILKVGNSTCHFPDYTLA